MSDTTYIQDRIFTDPLYPDGDTLKLDGNKSAKYVIENCVFSYMNADPTKQDEIISCFNGADVTIRNCLFFGGIKAILAGNGDSPIADTQRGRLEMYRCFIGNAGRRCPEVKHGYKAYLNECWFSQWGYCFDERAFGAWASHGGTIVAEGCIFTNNKYTLGFANRWRDRLSHISFAISQGGLSELLKSSNYTSGVFRGLTSFGSGTVYATRCYRNSKHIRIDNCQDFLTDTQATKIVANIASTCPDIADYSRLLLDLWDDTF